MKERIGISRRFVRFNSVLALVIMRDCSFAFHCIHLLRLLRRSFGIVGLFGALGLASSAAEPSKIALLENPFDVGYVKNHLNPTKPRLIYNEVILDRLKSCLDSDPVVKNLYQAIRGEAYGMLDLPLIERNKTTNAMLHVSRGLLRRMNFLGLVYLVERDPVILDRIDRELLAVSAFKDWNPPVYLDVAEICMAVSLALDWTLDDLPPTTIATAKQALIDKGIKPSWERHGGNPLHAWWVDHSNNWNQVCNGGLIAASVTIADVDPQLAAETIRRAMDGIPYVLAENYAPDGACPEGVMYWGYTTSYALLTLSILETSFGSDFGYRGYPGFMRSADFKMMASNLPTGGFYNFADCRDGRGGGGDMVLAWFAAETGKRMFYEKKKFLTPASDIRLNYLSGAFLAWMTRYEESGNALPPQVFLGTGSSPVVVFRDHDGEDGFFLGAKGGSGAVSHGHMDAGSFVFELDGVRWSIDPGIQGYGIGEQGFELWKQHQQSERWELFALNNFGHSTLTVDNKRHVVDGYATVSDSQLGERPSVTFDLGPTFEGQLASAKRTFTRTGERSLSIEDHLQASDSTQWITWQLVTRAEVECHERGATLRQGGKSLELVNRSHAGLGFEIVSLDPPPHRYDKHIEGLKRIELRLPVPPDDRDIAIQVELHGQ